MKNMRDGAPCVNPRVEVEVQYLDINNYDVLSVYDGNSTKGKTKFWCFTLNTSKESYNLLTCPSAKVHIKCCLDFCRTSSRYLYLTSSLWIDNTLAVWSGNPSPESTYWSCFCLLFPTTACTAPTYCWDALIYTLVSRLMQSPQLSVKTHINAFVIR